MPDITEMPKPDGRIEALTDYLDRSKKARAEIDITPPKGMEAYHIATHTALDFSIGENERLLRQLGAL